MKKIVLTVALVLLSSVAFAKKTATPQNHSCVLKEAVVEKTKKECLKAGGKWEKNSALAAPAAAKEEAKPVDSKEEAKPAESKSEPAATDAKPSDKTK